jgi:hypothetical protein
MPERVPKNMPRTARAMRAKRRRNTLRTLKGMRVKQKKSTRPTARAKATLNMGRARITKVTAMKREKVTIMRVGMTTDTKVKVSEPDT